MASEPKYKRSHSALNTKVMLPAFELSQGQVKGGGDSESYPSDPLEAAKSMGLVGEIFVMLTDDSEENFKSLNSILDLVPARVGGSIFNSNERVYDWLDKGAPQVAVDYNASNMGFLDGVPKDRICLVVTLTSADIPTVAGGTPLAEAMDEIAYFATYVMLRFEEQPTSERSVNRSVVGAAKDCMKKGMRLSVFDCTVTGDDVAWMDSQGIESIICSGIRDGSLTISQALGSCLVSDRPDGLIPTVVVDEDLVSLGLCYSKAESLEEALKRKVGVYWSRTRGLWIKGLTSGATQDLLKVDLDCDRDSMRFTVRQTGVGFCHMEQMSCFGEDHGTLGSLMRTLIDRKENAPAGSYTKRLFDDEALLKSKLLEECEELLAAKDNDEVAWETADVIYFAFAACARHGVNLANVQRNLARKALRVRRRPGNAKPPGWKPGDPSPDAAAGAST